MGCAKVVQVKEIKNKNKFGENKMELKFVISVVFAFLVGVMVAGLPLVIMNERTQSAFDDYRYNANQSFETIKSMNLHNEMLFQKKLNEKDMEIEKLNKELTEWRKTTLLIINQLNSWYASNPLVVEITHHSSSSSSLSNEDGGEIEVCELTSDDCGENQYLDASICMCVDRRPPIDEPKNNID